MATDPGIIANKNIVGYFIRDLLNPNMGINEVRIKWDGKPGLYLAIKNNMDAFLVFGLRAEPGSIKMAPNPEDSKDDGVFDDGLIFVYLPTKLKKEFPKGVSTHTIRFHIYEAGDEVTYDF